MDRMDRIKVIGVLADHLALKPHMKRRDVRASTDTKMPIVCGFVGRMHDREVLVNLCNDLDGGAAVIEFRFGIPRQANDNYWRSILNLRHLRYHGQEQRADQVTVLQFRPDDYWTAPLTSLAYSIHEAQRRLLMLQSVFKRVPSSAY